MLARAVMPVVIALTEQITLGIWQHMTAERILTLGLDSTITCHSDDTR